MNKHYIAGTKRILYGPVGKQPSRVVSKEIHIERKVWGEEEHVHNDRHCVKIMNILPGHRVSLHFHADKEETFILHSGHLIIESINALGEKDITELTKPLESFTLLKNIPHTFYCPDNQTEETVFIEASTTDYKDDSYRIEPSK